MLALGGRLTSGPRLALESLGASAAKRPDLVVTGCSVLDFARRGGGVLADVARVAAEALCPCIAFAGEVLIGSRELRTLTGLDVEEQQARRLLNDIAWFSAHQGLGNEQREEAASRWLTEIYEPLVAMVPRELRGRLEPAEIFHEVLVHRWFLSERAGREVDIFDTARDYIDRFLTAKPDEAITGQE